MSRNVEEAWKLTTKALKVIKQTVRAVNTYKIDFVTAFAELRGEDVLFDLFCGVGTIGLTLAASCRHLYGFEVRRRGLLYNK